MNNQKIKIGDNAPDFYLPDQNEKQIYLSNYKGKNVILCFYPRYFECVKFYKIGKNKKNR